MPRLRDITPCLPTTVANGLSHQIRAEINIVRPGILVDFSDLNISIGAQQFPFLQRRAKDALARAINSRGRTMIINSAYRTCAQQFLIRRWFDNGDPCNFGRAALPGRSNHESGLALDIRDHLGWKPYLQSQDWAWFGTGDRVHFDFRGGGTPIGDVGIKAFQNLWNRNFPSQPISDDGVYGPETAEKLSISPSEGFNSGELSRRVLRLISPLMQGGDVRRVQIKLKELGLINVGNVDGIYGETTETAVRRYQQDKNLTVDGVVGAITYEKLGIQ
jgi:peptidoglycan hydrolase-like protein with peptidoglycan-binding domain